MKRLNRLSVKQVRGLTKVGRYADGGGLYLQVLSPTNRSGLLRYELRGKERWKGLGSLDDFSWQEIRERARKDRQLLADKIDPLEVQRAERAKQAAQAAKARTFADISTRTKHLGGARSIATTS